ncbi:MAG: NAD-dependent epimerase/dehydratase family protein [Corynebacteriales bacterium]|nr:NAD-dependent epimerase/dehydratase family protein [Mycobacteriales bacterium]
MRILVIGPRGYLGSAVTEKLSTIGHHVVELVRRDDDPPERRYERRLGNLTDPDSLTAAVTPDIDAVINLATPTGDAAADAAAVAALTGPLGGTGRTFIYTSGVWVLGATGAATAHEDTPTNPIPIVGYRPDIEHQVLATARNGVRAIVIRPGIVHGRGRGIPALLVDIARKHGAPQIIADPEVRWPMVHVDDLANLFAAAVDQAPAGTLWHGVTQPAVPVRELATAAGRAAGLDGEPQVWPLEQAREELGTLFADALALDQSVSGQRAHDQLSWQAQHPDAIADLRDGSYR